MIFRSSSQETQTAGARPAFQVFLEVQNSPKPPSAVILQADHSRLAAEIAQHLRPDVFGELPAEVLDAIRDHDCGWERSDRDQVANATTQTLRPFLRLSPEETHPCWRESVRLAWMASPLKGVIVSRHFCALATQDPAHHAFAEEENSRRERVERDLNFPREDLDRWTAAIGFCDLVSLYLCCGAREPAEFPLAHSSLPDARRARKVVLEWVGGQPTFTSEIMDPGATVRAKALELPELRPIELRWQFLR